MKTRNILLRLSFSFFSFPLKNYRTGHRNARYVMREGELLCLQYEAFEIKAWEDNIETYIQTKEKQFHRSPGESLWEFFISIRKNKRERIFNYLQKAKYFLNINLFQGWVLLFSLHYFTNESEKIYALSPSE